MTAHNVCCRDDLDYEDVLAMRDAHTSRYWQDQDFHQVRKDCDVLGFPLNHGGCSSLRSATLLLSYRTLLMCFLAHTRVRTQAHTHTHT